MKRSRKKIRLIHINLLEFHTLFWVVYILLKGLRLSGSSMYTYVHFHQ
jgi:hypothetical protein